METHGESLVSLVGRWLCLTAALMCASCAADDGAPGPTPGDPPAAGAGGGGGGPAAGWQADPFAGTRSIDVRHGDKTYRIDDAKTVAAVMAKLRVTAVENDIAV